MLMLLALVLSVMALLPARAQTGNVVTGLVMSQCGSPTPTYLSGATVTLSDANGVLPSLSTSTDGAGVYSFTPPAGTYTISVSKAGYYSNSTPKPPSVSPFRFDGSTTVTVDVCLDVQPASTGTVTFAVQTAAAQPIGGAMLSIYNPARLSGPYSALIFTNITNATTGKSYAGLWSGSFDVRVSAYGYLPYEQTLSLTPPTSQTITMTPGVSVLGHARNTAGQFISAGLVGWLYNISAPKSSGMKIIPAFVNSSLFTFSAPNGIYRLIVDADGYKANDTSITIPTTNPHDVKLQASPQELDKVTVAFGYKDWNNITVNRSLRLNPDSTLTGLLPAGLRDLRQEINYTLGNGLGSGVVSAGDVNAFKTWFQKNGPLYVTTDTFLLVNGKSYNSTASSFKVSVSSSINTTGAPVWINTSATYTLKSTAWITYGASKYYLNLTVIPATNTTVYHNMTYLVELPTYYEMVSDTLLPNAAAISTYNYTHITVIPSVTGQGVRMVIQQSLTGIARAKVIGPAGKFYVANSTYQHYQAYVANGTNITFSAAETSNPPSNDATRDNFTWKFLGNVSVPNPPNNVRYGIQPTFEFAVPGPYIVNLTAVGSGGNVSFRNIDIWVDGLTPTANFKTNVTGSGSAVGMSLHANEGVAIRFDASLSTDLAYTGKPGVILNSGYAWNWGADKVTDAVGRIANNTFSKPGIFTVNLTVTDSVGNKAANVSLTITVNDTAPPKPGFTILDPSNEYAPTTTLIEMRNYTFNASTTTDDYDKLAALNFTWYIPGPVIGQLGLGPHKMWGLNITFGWSEWNTSYPVKLVVNDTGFGSGKPNSGTLTQNVSVEIDHRLHPDLSIVVGSSKIDNSNPESGQTVTVTLNVTNAVGWGTANQVYVQVTETGGGQTNDLAPTWSMVDLNGTALSTIASGKTAVFTISFAVVGQGNRTLTVLVADHNMPFTLIGPGNKANFAIVAKQPAWVNYAIIGTVVAVFALVIFAMYYRRKVKAGDWQPRFRRGGKEEGGKEKPKKEKEVKEEKKRL